MRVTPETRPFATSIVGLGHPANPFFGLTSLPAPCLASPPPGELGLCPILRPDLALAMLPLINADRAKTGGGPVGIDARLTACAEWKALSTGGFLYLAHDDEGTIERPWYQRFADYYPTNSAFGENIAYGFLDAPGVMAAFLSDVGHKANVENQSWAGVGLAVAMTAPTSSMPGLLFWVQDYGSDPVGPTPPPPPPPPPPPTVPLVEKGWRYRNSTTGVEIEVTADVPADASPTWPVSYKNVKNGKHGALRLKLFKQRYARV